MCPIADLTPSKKDKNLLSKKQNKNKNVMWSDKTRHMVQNWYFELLVLCESLNYSLSRTFYLNRLWYCYQKLQCSKAIKIKKDCNYLCYYIQNLSIVTITPSVFFHGKKRRMRKGRRKKNHDAMSWFWTQDLLYSTCRSHICKPLRLSVGKMSCLVPCTLVCAQVTSSIFQ